MGWKACIRQLQSILAQSLEDSADDYERWLEKVTDEVTTFAWGCCSSLSTRIYLYTIILIYTPNQKLLDHYNGDVTMPRTSSITSSGPTPSNNALIASSLLPHCILRSLSGAVIMIRWMYIFLAARPTKAGFTKSRLCSGAKHRSSWLKCFVAVGEIPDSTARWSRKWDTMFI